MIGDGAALELLLLLQWMRRQWLLKLWWSCSCTRICCCCCVEDVGHGCWSYYGRDAAALGGAAADSEVVEVEDGGCWFKVDEMQRH